MQGLQLKSFVVGAMATVGGIFGIAWMADSAGEIKAGIPENIGALAAPVSPRTDISALNNAYKDVAKAVSQSVVSISVTVESDVSTMFGLKIPDEYKEEYERRFGGQRSKGAGSGVIVSSDGYIITNNHVIDGAIDGNEGIEVVLNDRRKYSATVIGSDELTDLAVIKIEADDLTPAHLGDMSSVEVGQIVFAVGNPLGLSGTVTSGIVSAISRGGMSGGSYKVSNYIQTDAAINPGNSGGGLFDINGSLVGINTAIATGTGNYIGYGFAIPIDLTRAVAYDLIEDGEIDRGYIGVAIKTIDDNVTAKGLGLDEITGVMIKQVYPESAGERAGLEMGDVILEVDGKEVISSNELQSIIATYRANDEVTLTIFREGERINTQVRLKARDEDEDLLSFKEDKAKDEDLAEESLKRYELESLGMEVAELDKDIMESVDLDYGVVVEGVERYGLAYNRSIYEGLVITEVDGKKINNVYDFKTTIESKKPGDIVKVLGQSSDRDGRKSQQMIFLEIPAENME